jgi:malate/lactate dehydrogenase
MKLGIVGAGAVGAAAALAACVRGPAREVVLVDKDGARARARVAEIVLRDERAVIPVGSHQPEYGVTLSLPSVVGRGGVAEAIVPELSAEEREGLEASVDRLKDVVGRYAAAG